MNVLAYRVTAPGESEPFFAIVAAKEGGGLMLMSSNGETTWSREDRLTVADLFRPATKGFTVIPVVAESNMNR